MTANSTAESGAPHPLQEALEGGDMYFRALIENASDAIVILDQNGAIRYTSPSVEQVAGYLPEELSGQSMLEYLHPDDLSGVTEAFAHLLQNPSQPVRTQTRVRHKDGSWRTLEATGTNLLDEPTVAGVVASFRDVTERRRAEQALEESEARYRAVVEQASEGIVLYDALTKRVLEANPAYRDLLGYSADEMLGLTLYDIVAHDRDSIDAHVQRILTQGYRLIGKRQHRHKDGSLVDVEVSANRIAYGGREAMCVVVRDITKRVQAEAELGRYRDRLEEAVESRTAELTAANQQLQWEIAERQRAQDELNALQATVLDITTPHDLPTLLQTIVERAASLLQASSGGIYLCEPAQDQVRCVVSYNTPRDYAGTLLKYGEGAAGSVAETGEALIIDDYRTWPGRAAVYEEEQPFRAVLSVPMVWQDQVTGVIDVLHDVAGQRFTQADLVLLAQFANHAAIAVENTRLYEQAQGEIKERARAERELSQYRDQLEKTVEERTASLIEVNEQLEREILERVWVEEALRQSEQEYRTLVDTIDDLVFTADAGGNILFANLATKRFTGCEIEQITGHNIVEYVHPDDVPGLTAEFDRVLNDRESAGAAGGIGQDVEYRLVKQNGEVIWVATRNRLIRNAQGNIVGITGISRDITERQRAKEQVEDSLHEKEVLLQEIHHRVKNNLQIISSLLSLQAEHIKNQRALEVLEDSRDRVRSMALIHEKLYRSGNLARIDMADYVEDLATYLLESFQNSIPGTVKLSIQAEPIFLNIDRAVPCGLILNELISNSFKHAFPPAWDRSDGRDKEIRIGLSQGEDHQITLTVADNGVGLPPDLDAFSTQSLGLQLVNVLVEQLDATLRMNSQGGAQFEIRLALP